MSDKMQCPGCMSYTSSIRRAVEDNEPCPSCGLSADAIAEIYGIQRSRADEALKARLQAAIITEDQALAAVREMHPLVRELIDVAGKAQRWLDADPSGGQ
jgi:hypothetical protein